jgi:hypothetical protein
MVKKSPGGGGYSVCVKPRSSYGSAGARSIGSLPQSAFPTTESGAESYSTRVGSLSGSANPPTTENRRRPEGHQDADRRLRGFAPTIGAAQGASLPSTRRGRSKFRFEGGASTILEGDTISTGSAVTSRLEWQNACSSGAPVCLRWVAASQRRPQAASRGRQEPILAESCDGIYFVWKYPRFSETPRACFLPPMRDEKCEKS